MNFLELFTTKKERNRTIGSYETTTEHLGRTFMAMMNSIGLSNPSTVRIYSSQAVSITRKGDIYVMTLKTFKPPIKIEWSGLLPMDQLNAVLEKVALEQKNIAYVNTSVLSTGTEYFQLALA